MNTKQKGVVGFGIILLILGFAPRSIFPFIPIIPQNEAFHQFVDQRGFLGIPNFLDVFSNIGFLVVGLLGLRRFIKASFSMSVFFGAVTWVTFGSSYYHWNPNTAALVWDRLPMSVAFMALIAALFEDRILFKTSKILTLTLCALGAFSVCLWKHSEDLGQSDIRPYAFVQFGSLLMVVVILIASRDQKNASVKNGAVWISFLGYALAKILEAKDAQIFEILGQSISGHSLKHLVAAAALWPIVKATQPSEQYKSH